MADLLGGVSARGAVMYRAAMPRGWSIRIADGAPLMLVAVLDGGLWVVPAAGSPVRADAGDIAIITESSPYVVADEPDIPPQLVALPGDRYTTVDGLDVTERMVTGARTASMTPDAGATEVVHCTYRLVGDVSHRLRAALPGVLVVPAKDLPGWLIPRLADEVPRDLPGQDLILDKLLDLTFVVAVRAWLQRSETPSLGLYRAQADPVVGHGLRLIHADPRRSWTVAELAAAVGVSRAWFARRFTELVGCAPITYVTDTRITYAAGRLRRTDVTMAALAREVGYADAFTFSTAFKRVTGVGPDDYRRGADEKA